HHARTGAELQDVGSPDLLEDFDALVREAAAEERRDLGRGDEIARLAELRGASAVVPEPGLIEGELHEALEADPTLMRVDLVANAIAGARRMCRLVGRERR